MFVFSLMPGGNSLGGRKIEISQVDETDHNLFGA
jgi:hypothetical protein